MAACSTCGQPRSCNQSYPDPTFPYGCVKPYGHDGPHGYAGMFWESQPTARPPHPDTQIGRLPCTCNQEGRAAVWHITPCEIKLVHLESLR